MAAPLLLVHACGVHVCMCAAAWHMVGVPCSQASGVCGVVEADGTHAAAQRCSLMLPQRGLAPSLQSVACGRCSACFADGSRCHQQHAQRKARTLLPASTCWRRPCVSHVKPHPVWTLLVSPADAHVCVCCCVLCLMGFGHVACVRMCVCVFGQRPLLLLLEGCVWWSRCGMPRDVKCCVQCSGACSLTPHTRVCGLVATDASTLWQAHLCRISSAQHPRDDAQVALPATSSTCHEQSKLECACVSTGALCLRMLCT